MFVAVELVVAVLGGEPPASDQGRLAISRYYLDHAAGLEAGLWLFGLGVIALTFWAGGLWQWMTNGERGSTGLAAASLLGLSIAGALALVASAAWATVALHLDTVGDDLSTFHALGGLLSSAAGIGVAAHLLATNLFGWSGRQLPNWILVTGFASAGAWIAQAIVASTSATGATNPIGLAAFALWCGWILAVSHRLWTAD